MSRSGAQLAGDPESAAPSKRAAPNTSMPIAAEKMKEAAQSGANSTAVRSPVSGQYINHFKSKTR